MTDFKLIDKCLRATISTDETRVNLQGVYFDSKDQRAVSTNGCAMTISESMYDAELADKIVNFKEMRVVQQEYVKYQSVIPTKTKHTAVVTIGKNVDIKQRRVEYKAYFVAGEFIISNKVVDGYMFALDPKYLKPLIGYTLEVKFDGELQPIMFTLKEDDSYYIVMPMKV